MAWRRGLPDRPAAILPQRAAIPVRRASTRGRWPNPVLSDAWAPLDLLKGVAESALRKNLIYQLLLAQGVVFDRVVQEIGAESADPENAALLNTEVGAPLLRITRLLHDTDARPIQHLTARSSPDRTRMLMDISASSIGALGAGALVYDV